MLKNDGRITLLWVLPMWLVQAAGRAIVHFQLEIADGRVTTCYLIVNPEKVADLMSQNREVLRP